MNAKIFGATLVAGLLMTTQAVASEIFSCKAIAKATIKSDIVFGDALFGDAEESSWMAGKASKVLQLGKTKIIFDDKEFTSLGGSGGSLIFADSYWGLAEIYDNGSAEVTLFLTRSNGFNDQRTNYLNAEMWFCNK